MHKQDDVRAAVIARLWELCDGAEPAMWEHPQKCDGICPDIERTCKVDIGDLLGCTVGALVNDGQFSIYIFPVGDWGNERRTLAGFLAAWLEDEQP